MADHGQVSLTAYTTMRMFGLSTVDVADGDKKTPLGSGVFSVRRGCPVYRFTNLQIISPTTTQSLATTGKGPDIFKNYLAC